MKKKVEGRHERGIDKNTERRMRKKIIKEKGSGN